jgi:hypothetical protein
MHTLPTILLRGECPHRPDGEIADDFLYSTHTVVKLPGILGKMTSEFTLHGMVSSVKLKQPI